MSSVDEAAAWDLVLAIAPEDAEGAGRTASPAGATLEWAPDGSWHTTPPCDPAAQELIELYLPLRLRPDLVIGQLGQSLDGRIATEAGHSHYINGPEDLLRLHRLRALVDAVVVGAGTVVADDPRLTVRRASGDHPVRVVLDPTGRVPATRGVFRDPVAPTLWVQAGIEGEEREGPAPHVRVVGLPVSAEGGFEPQGVVRLLRSRGFGPLLVEGGGRTVSGFLRAGALHRLHVSVAPLLIGSGRPGLTLPVIEELDDALRPPVRHFRLGDDLLFDLNLDPPATRPVREGDPPGEARDARR